MPRILIAAFAAALASTSVVMACGGGDSPAATPSPAPTESPTPEPNKQPTAEDRVMPTPTQLPGDAIAFVVVSGKTTYSPNPDEARALDRTSVTAEGKTYTGISVATLAKKVSAKAETIFTIQGVRSDGKRIGFIRGSLTEMGATTVFVPLEDGHFNVVTSSLPSQQWISFANSLAFQ
jgi:hypothetical protein